MAHLNKKGPDNEGQEKGRKLGICSEVSEKKDYPLGKGMGKRRKSAGCDTEPKAKRKKAGKIIL